MGFNARRDAVLTTLAALEAELRRAGLAVPPGGGVSAALTSYETERERGHVPVGTGTEHSPVLASEVRP
jgi:(S)-ureidoglycine-glyoxylate aminotransferase